MEEVLKKSNEEISSILTHIYENKVKTNEDKENLIKMYHTLKNNYQFIDSTDKNLNNILSSGSFIYYINFDKIDNSKIKFTKSGFVINDNGDLVELTNYGKYWKIKKEKYLIFQKFSPNQILRINMLNLSK